MSTTTVVFRDVVGEVLAMICRLFPVIDPRFLAGVGKKPVGLGESRIMILERFFR